ncbi:MAG: double zinc ribbon domain-containing protein [Pirellula sp.]
MKHERVRRWRHHFRPLVDLVFPRVCGLCNAPVVDLQREALCARCEFQLVATEHRCLRCSAPLNAARRVSRSAQKRCYYCERRRWSFRQAYCYTAYSGLAARATKRIKQPDHEPLAIEIGIKMANWLLQSEDFDVSRFDCVVPVPQHWMRRIVTRYNQAEVLAEQVANAIGLPLNRRCLYRTRWTEKQGTKSINERLGAVVNSFACKPLQSLQDAGVLLIDDVVTSGATASDAARALRKAGAARVDVAAFSRGVGAFKKASAKLPDVNASNP